MFMNNFTKKSGRAYWHSITNLTCSSPSFRKLQTNSIKALMLLMFFTLSTGALFAQNPDLGTGIHEADTEGCLLDLPAPHSIDYLMALPEFDDCRNSGEAFLLEFRPENNSGIGEFGVVSGFAAGSTDCSWTYYYVYTLKCNGVATPFTVEYDGGDTTQPKLRKGKVIPPGQKDMNLCYADIPEPHTLDYIAGLFQDNCDHLKVSDFVTMKTKTKQDDCKWIVIYVYSIWDHCTEPIEVSITYTGGDTQDPWFTSELPKKDITVDCDNIPDPVTLNWADNCTEGKLKVKSQDDTSQLGIGCEGGVITRTWEILDDCNNYNEYIQYIKVNPAPLVYFYPTQDINVACEDRATIDGLIGELGYTNGRDSDRCGIYGYAKPTYTIPETSCGSFEVTYTFTDDCGYTINASLTVNIIDDEDPSIDIAANDMTVECDGDGNVEAYATWLANIGGAMASDNCDTDLTWSNDDATHPFSDECGSTGEKTIIFTVTDDCENQSKTFATFRIVDTLAPKVDPATDLTVICDGSGNSEQYLDWIVHQGGASASDDCSEITWSHDGPDFDPKKYDLTDFDQFVEGCSTYAGYVQVTFTATDACGLSTDTTATFSIEDSIAPVISTPASDMTVECDGSVHDLIDWYLDDIQASSYGTNNAKKLYDWAITQGGAIADPDLCSDVKWAITNAYLTGNDCDYNINLTWTASDACGNESSTSATFHVVDTNSPAIGQEAGDLIVECDGQGNVAEYQNWLDTNAGAYAMDACSDITWSNNSASQSFSKDCGLTGAIDVLFTVTDECGLTSSTEATFTIRDITRPTFTAPDDTTIYKDAACNYDAYPHHTGDVTDEYDGCSVGQLEATYTDSFKVGDCPGDTVITRTWYLDDDCGNKAYEQVQIIYVKDNSAPVLTGTLPGPLETSNLDLCEAPVGPSEADIAALYTDNCTAVLVTKTANEVQTGECGWATQYTYEISDECGNMLDPLKILYFGRDQSAPVLAKDMSLPAGNDKLTTCLYEALNGDGAGATVDEVFKLFTDNCDTKVEVYKSDPIYVYNYECTYHYYYEFTVVDNCDNPYKFKQHFEGSDNDAPVLKGVIPEDVSEINECLDEALQGTAAGLSEDQMEDLYSECSMDPGYGVNVTKVTNTFGDDCNWIITHHYTIEDDCGNFADPVKITYSGGDKDAPVFDLSQQIDTTLFTMYDGADCPANADITLKVGQVISVFDNWYVAGIQIPSLNSQAYTSVYDDCTAEGDLIIRVTNITNSKDSCDNVITVTFEAEDSCGNVSAETFTCKYTIVDDTNPTGSVPADVAVECTSEIPAVNIKDVTHDDNCNVTTVTHVGDVSDGNFNPEVITRTYRIEDACGNYIDLTQIITVQDKTSPEVTCEVDQDFGVNPVLDNGIPAAIPETASYTDNCDPDGVTSTFSDVLQLGVHGFNGDFDPAKWATVNGGGSVSMNNSTLTLTGNNNGGGGVATQATITCPVSGEFTFDWDYLTNDVDGPSFDPAFYINGVFQQLTNSGGADSQSGSLTVNCAAGDVIGFAVVPTDGILGSASLTITNFHTESGLVRTFTQVDASGNVGECSTTYTWHIVDDVVTAVDSGKITLSAEELTFRAYPVPFNKDVNIKYNFEFDTDVTIQVYDTKGLLVLSKTVQGYRSGSDMTLPLSISGSDQLYYVKLITNRGTVIKKIVSSNVDKE
jgi:hypothetical protein